MMRLLKDIEDLKEINAKIDQIGYNIGLRLIDDVIDNLNTDTRGDHERTPQQLMEELIRICLLNYLRITGIDIKLTAEKEYSILFSENPLNLYVELPEKYKDLIYSNIICGILRGMLEVANFKVECSLENDMLKGSRNYEIKLKLIEVMEEKFIDDDDK